MLVGGEASIDGTRSSSTRSVLLRPGEPMTLASERGGRVMLLGGEAFATRRHVYWNFVSSSRERIEQAKEDWTAGRFPLVPGDEAEFIPLPDKPKTVTYPSRAPMTEPGTHPRQLAAQPSPAARRRSAMLELFFDLVYVFAITQISHLILEHIELARARPRRRWPSRRCGGHGSTPAGGANWARSRARAGAHRAAARSCSAVC